MLGLGPGAAYAGLGLGLVFTYRGSGILNLAHGAMAMYPTYVFAELRANGNLVVPGVPGTHHLGTVGTGEALAIALVVAALLGLVVHLLIFGPLSRRAAPPLASVVATVGLVLSLQAMTSLRFGSSPRNVVSLLPQQSVVVAGVRVPADRLYLAALVLVVAAAITFVHGRTRFGLASRAVAESVVGASLLGLSPNVLGAMNWVIGSVLAGLFGILLAPIAGLHPLSYTFLVVPALAAALAGRLSSTWVTAGVGLGLGIAQSELTRVRLPIDWLGPQVLREVLPFLVLAVVVTIRGTPVPRRGAGRVGRLPPALMPNHPGRVLLVVLVVGTAGLTMLTGGYRSAVIVSLIGALLCLSVVVLTGFAGQISLAQMSFAGIAGFVLSRLTVDAAMPFPFGLLLAALAAGMCGLLVGLPALRARGVSFAVMTLGAALAVEELIFRNLSRGLLSTDAVPPAQIGALDLRATARDGAPRVVFGFFVLGVLCVACFAVMRLRRSRLGQRMLAVRANERAAAAAGVNIATTKLAAFAVSAFIAGLGGTLMGYHQGALSDQSFDLARSLALLAAAYLGGIGTVIGALVGGLLLPGGVIPVVAERALRIGQYQQLVSGLAVVAAAVFYPEGVTDAWRARLAGRRRQ